MRHIALAFLCIAVPAYGQRPLPSPNISGSGAGGSGTVTSITTVAPISGGPITTTGPLSCPLCVTSSSPGAGIAHFAGGTQAVTSSLIVNADIAGGTIAASKLVGTDIGTVGTITAGTWNSSVIGSTYGGLGAALNATAAHSTVISNGATPAVYSASTIPDCQDSGGNHINYTQSTDAFSCGTSSGASGANTALSNLAAVSVNAALGFQSGIAVGTTAHPASDIVMNLSGTYGTGSITFGGTPTLNRTVTFPDATDTVAELGQANAFTAAQTVTITSVGTAHTAAATLTNTTAAANNAQQDSPCVFLTGQGWKTNATAASQTVDWCLQNTPAQAAANPDPQLTLFGRTNAGTWYSYMILGNRSSFFGAPGAWSTMWLGPNISPSDTNWMIAQNSAGNVDFNSTSAGNGLAFFIDGTLKGHMTSTEFRIGGTNATWVDYSLGFTQYAGILTVSNGVPAEYATVDLTAQTAAITATALYTPAATRMFRVSYTSKVTTAASTSSILGGTTGLVLAYTDGGDSVAQTAFTCPADDQNGTALAISSGNTTNTTQTVSNGSCIIWAKTGVGITYAYGYTSVGATPMAYELHVKVEAM